MKYQTGKTYFVKSLGSKYTRAAVLLDGPDRRGNLTVKLVDSGCIINRKADEMVAGPVGPITEEVIRFVMATNFDTFMVSERELEAMKEAVVKIAEATGLKKPKKREFNLPSSK